MQWQDWVFTSGQLIFVFALIPTIRGRDKPALSTSLITGLIIITFSYTQLTLKLYFSSITGMMAATAWLTLAFQKYQQLKNEKQK